MLVEACQGLVELDKVSNVVRFTHFTVQEFLERTYLGNLLSQVDIGKVCVTYLTFDVFEERYLSHQRFCDQRKHSYRFTDYVFRYWGRHVRGEGEENSEILEALLRFSSDASWAPYSHYSWTPLHLMACEVLVIVYDRIISNT